MDLESLWIEYREKDSSIARDKILAEYAPLVRYTAQRMAINLPQSIELGDLIGAGVMGLIKAVEAFDLSREVKFETYATHKIRSAILDDLRNRSWIPRSIIQKSNMVKKAYAELEKELLRTPYDNEVAKHLGMEPAEFDELLAEIAPVTIVSLSEIISNNSDSRNTALIEVIEDPEAENPVDKIDAENIKRILTDALADLPEKEKLVIALYHYEEMTLKEIAQALSLTESRVSQIHSKAMIKLRAKLQTRI